VAAALGVVAASGLLAAPSPAGADIPPELNYILPGAIAGQPYSATLADVVPTYPYPVQFEQGRLPPGLVLSSSGVLSGTPEPSVSAPDTYYFEAETTVNYWYAITVTTPGYVGPSTLHITTTSLPEVIIGRPYSATIGATGGTPPYSWRLEGTLPEGLRFADGTISGEAVLPEQSTFYISLVDSGNQSLGPDEEITQGQALLEKFTLTVGTGVGGLDSLLAQTGNQVIALYGQAIPLLQATLDSVWSLLVSIGCDVVGTSKTCVLAGLLPNGPVLPSLPQL
jgi:hypothetical protein